METRTPGHFPASGQNFEFVPQLAIKYGTALCRGKTVVGNIMGNPEVI